ncbi:hypothetical protein QBC33DRAFT_523025 [Phialemonium atrogriseum]|uniref:Genetic interactor of prohibitins 3, mitochondrial n=1 Tax=Phialemonium atrogriseum TaxID=1093897 RepID=A0AAJ0FLU7_9PEZI|nr:uncharacterized protein QBC33DRAFT_523025 [Phialemonium atrogriseum]KAK1772976.1 hypothetical protein QBC33DRAFT_523025 [Phialemonium atrogriseum]
MQSSRSISSKWLRRAFNIGNGPLSSELPLYLCPSLVRSSTIGRRTFVYRPSQAKAGCRQQARRLHTYTESASATTPPIPSSPRPLRTLPLQCSGCGALSQTSLPNQAGYYDSERKSVGSYLGLLEEEKKRVRDDDRVVQDALRSLELNKLGGLGTDLKTLLKKPTAANSSLIPESSKAPLCDRCHNLIHHHVGNPIYHPTIESLRETIEESPYKYNHVYHVVDAADFPMSLLPRINQLIDMMPLRSQNRRSRSGKYHRGRKTEMSFIITRSDLLAPVKQQVDSLMPYLKDTLRDALGRAGKHVRLGNVRCVSAKRGWWTKELKEEVWERGGAGWMVGKVNVGKSQLFEAAFPKGRMDWTPPKHQISVPVFPAAQPKTPVETISERTTWEDAQGSSAMLENNDMDESSLLPPAQVETNYPAMPVVSSLPGTTASPIRVPFGNGKGELVDLPGLARSDLEMHVKEEHRASLVMKSRVLPEQQVIRPGRSLLLGGFIRITPKTPDLTFLAYAFTPIEPHLTSTEKAILVQEQSEEAPNVDNISVPGTGAKIQQAGSFQLRYDVTKPRTGPITRRDAAGINIDRLPYRVLAIDILIEGCGWVEIVAQVRTNQLFATTSEARVEETKEVTNPERLESLDLSDPEPGEKNGVANPEKLESLDLSGPEPEAHAEPEASSAEPNWPVIEVFSPEGKFIGSRRPMNAWLLNKPKNTTTRSRPRRSMKGAKKREKSARRASETVGGPE